MAGNMFERGYAFAFAVFAMPPALKMFGSGLVGPPGIFEIVVHRPESLARPFAAKGAVAPSGQYRGEFCDVALRITAVNAKGVQLQNFPGQIFV